MAEYRSVEVTAPCALLLHPNLAVAIDRRAWCRVEGWGGGLVLESKDGPLRTTAACLAELSLDESLQWLAPLLGAASVDAGLRIVLHGRVPAGTGLGVRAALAVALASALGESAQRSATASAVCDLVRSSLPALAALECWTAALGGVVSVAAGAAGGRPVPTDPGAVEERLMLWDVGLAATALHGGTERRSGVSAETLVEALTRRAFGEVGALLAAEWAQALAADSAAGRLAEYARALEGHAWLCGPGGAAGLMAVWIAPDGRRALVERVRESALAARPVACRLDLRGLDLERF